MSGVVIYVEGGGESTDGKAAIRRGFDEFLAELKERARARRWRWRVVACGGRDQAKDAFLHARANDPDVHAFLLVDSEEQVAASPPRHLSRRDHWDLGGVADGAVHLMAQVMETWLVAHPEALAAYYGQGFRANALPNAQDLETVAKPDVERALSRATRDTQKGEYHKIRHVEDLLRRLDPAIVRTRCAHCERLFRELATLIERA